MREGRGGRTVKGGEGRNKNEEERERFTFYHPILDPPLSLSRKYLIPLNESLNSTKNATHQMPHFRDSTPKISGEVFRPSPCTAPQGK